jgi:DNA replication protein DnaC
LTKTIEEFDFNFQAGLKRSVLGGFLGPELFREGHNLILSGQPGCGKAHPAISIAYRAIQNGYTARLVDASPLIDELAEAARQGRLREGTVQCVKLDRMVFTTIKRPRDGGCVLHDNDLEEVILDRVRKRGQHVQLGGSSWRNRHLDPEDLVSPSNHPENPLSPGAPQNP